VKPKPMAPQIGQRRSAFDPDDSLFRAHIMKITTKFVLPWGSKAAL
jgi:hypothetical protein